METTKIPDVGSSILGTLLTVTFKDGRTLEVDTTELTPEIVLQATLHGLKQKLVDAAAIARNPDTGKSATLQDKFDAVAEVHARILAGQWNKTRGDGSAKGSKSYLCEALMELYKKDRATITEWLKSKTKEEVAALKLDDNILPIINRMEREKAAASTIDTGSILAGLAELN